MRPIGDRVTAVMVVGYAREGVADMQVARTMTPDLSQQNLLTHNCDSGKCLAAVGPGAP